MIACLVTVKHMSAAGLGESLKLITHLHKHTKLWIVSAPQRHICWHVPVVSLLLQLLDVDFFCSDQCAHDSRHCRRTGFLCGNINEIYFVVTPTFVPLPFWKAVPVSRQFRDRTWKNFHSTLHKWLRRSLICSQDEGTYMHMNMVGDFPSMIQCLMTALPLIHKTSVFLPRQMLVTSRSAPVAPVSRLHSLVSAAEHATCRQCSHFSARTQVS